ncbi:hypothetical protein D9M68_697480 [compost metagenome]
MAWHGVSAGLQTGLAQHGITYHQHATLEEAQPFAHRKTEEADVAKGSHAISAHPCAEGLGCVFDCPSPNISRASQGGGHVTHTPAQVGRYHSQGMGVAKSSQVHDVHVERVDLQVAHIQLQSAMNHRQRHQWTRVGRNDHLIALGCETLECRQRHHQCGSAGAFDLSRLYAQKRRK